MYSLNQVKTLDSCGRDSARSLPLRRGFLLIPLILACFALLPQMQAAPVPDVLPSPLPGYTNPDGCYANFTTAEGCNALHSLTSGLGNSAVGWYSLWGNSDANFNTGVGGGALALNNGDSNTAVGAAALLLNTNGTRNTGLGTDALVYNDSATDNTAVGFEALFNNLDAGNNTAVGSNALFNNDADGTGKGAFNNAVGANALQGNTDGFSNNALGESALFFNIIGADNTAVGDLALETNDADGAGMANNNVGVGASTLLNNHDGSENTAVGTGAGPNLVVGFNNTYIGNFVGTDADEESSTIRIGDLSNGNGAGSLECYIGGIFNNPQPIGGDVVVVTLDLTNDHLGWDVLPGQAPVQAPHRPAPTRRGVERPAPQHQAMLKLQATVAQQQRQIESLTAQLKAQAEQIQKVSAQLEMIRPTPRVVNNQ